MPVNVTGDTDGSFGDWYGGHEIGHTFGRLHPGFCNGNSADDPSFPNPNGQISDNAGTYTGLDTGDPSNNIPVIVLPGVSRFDIMTYCNQPQWLSAYAYEGVRNRLNAEDPSGTGPPGSGGPRSAREIVTPQGIHFKPGCACPSVKPYEDEPARIKTEREKPLPPLRAYAAPLPAPRPQRRKPERPDVQGKEISPPKPALAAPASVQRLVLLAAVHPAQAVPEKMQMELKEGRFVSIIGTLNLTRHSGKILYVTHVPRALVPNRVAEARVFIRFLNRRGKLLTIRPATVREDTDVPPNEDRTAVFDAVVEELANVGAVELVLDEKVLDRRTVSLHPPAVKGVRISAADARGARVLHWQSHPEKRPLTYLVQISSDGGKTWYTLAVGLRERRLELTPEQLKDRAAATIRVIGNDGYNDSEAATVRLPGTSTEQRQ